MENAFKFCRYNLKHVYIWLDNNIGFTVKHVLIIFIMKARLAGFGSANFLQACKIGRWNSYWILVIISEGGGIVKPPFQMCYPAFLLIYCWCACHKYFSFFPEISASSCVPGVRAHSGHLMDCRSHFLFCSQKKSMSLSECLICSFNALYQWFSTLEVCRTTITFRTFMVSFRS